MAAYELEAMHARFVRRILASLNNMTSGVLYWVVQPLELTRIGLPKIGCS